MEDECPLSPPSDSVNGSMLFNAKPKLFSSASDDPENVQLVRRTYTYADLFSQVLYVLKHYDVHTCGICIQWVL